MTETPDASPPADSDHVTVSRGDVRGLRDMLVGVVVGVLVLGAAFLVRTVDQDRIADEQQVTTERQDRTDDRLEALILRENREDEREEAEACVASHEAYVGVGVIVHRVAVAAGVDPAAEPGLLAGFEPPTCDVEAAAEVIAGGG